MKEKKETKIKIRLFAGSIIGLCFFMLPFEWKGSMTIPLSFVKDLISAPLESALPLIVMALVTASAILSIIFTIRKKEETGPIIKSMFVVSPLTILIRLIAVAVTIAAYLKLGPEMLWNENTGGLIVFSLMPSLLVLFYLGSTFLPLLTDYGAMELIGSVVQPVFRPLFRIPGRAAVLALSCWFGTGSIGMLTTDEEYKKGYYTGREAAIICFGFCIVTFPSVFSYTTSIGGLEVGTFSYFFLTLVLIGILSTVILSRIPPITLIPDTYYQDRPNSELTDEKAKAGSAYDRAYRKAEHAPGIPEMFRMGLIKSLKLYMNVFPLIILFATIVLILTEYTPVFSIIATPLVPVLNALGIPEADLVAPALLTGFADLLLPFLAATGIESQLAKFIVCIVGTIQVICMSETGMVLLKTEIPVKFRDLVIVFLEKTIIAVPIALIMGRLIGLT